MTGASSRESSPTLADPAWRVAHVVADAISRLLVFRVYFND